MLIRTTTKEKGNRYAKVRYHIPFYASSFFETDKEEEETKMIKLPVKILEEEGESRSNVTTFSIPAIAQFDGELEKTLISLSTLRAKVVKPRQLENNKEIKLNMKYLGLICVGTAVQTMLEAAKAARKHVVLTYLETEYDINAVQRDILIEDEGTFFEFLEREFNELDDQFEDSAAFTAYLFKRFDQMFWNHLHAVMFGADAYRAFKTQREYLKTKIVKPHDVGVEKAFRRVDHLTNLLNFFPPTGSKGRMASPEQWETWTNDHWIPYPEKREMKHNLLPDVFQDRLEGLEEDWADMSHAKFLSEAHKCEVKDKAVRLEKEKADKSSGKRKRGDGQSNLSRTDKDRNDKGKARREQDSSTGAGKARFCALCHAAGAPEYVCKTHNTKDCNKKEHYEKLLSGGTGSRQKAKNEFSQSEKKFCKEFKIMAKKVKHLEAKNSRKKTRRRGENSDDSSFASSTDEGF